MLSETNKLSALLETENAKRAQKKALLELVICWPVFALCLAYISFAWGMMYGMSGSTDWSSWVMMFGIAVSIGGLLVRKTMSLGTQNASGD